MRVRKESIYRNDVIIDIFAMLPLYKNKKELIQQNLENFDEIEEIIKNNNKSVNIAKENIIEKSPIRKMKKMSL